MGLPPTNVRCAELVSASSLMTEVWCHDNRVGDRRLSHTIRFL
jgi:hypothetical protein